MEFHLTTLQSPRFNIKGDDAPNIRNKILWWLDNESNKVYCLKVFILYFYRNYLTMNASWYL